MDKIFLFWAKIIKKYTKFMVSGRENLEKHLKKNKKMLIIFWHPLCGPCKKIMFLTPILYTFYALKWFKMKFIDIKENLDIAEFLDIKVTPTMISFKEWKPVKKFEDEEVMKNLFKP